MRVLGLAQSLSMRTLIDPLAILYLLLSVRLQTGLFSPVAAWSRSAISVKQSSFGTNIDFQGRPWGSKGCQILFWSWRKEIVYKRIGAVLSNQHVLRRQQTTRGKQRGWRGLLEGDVLLLKV